ncbi:MAG: leucine-rich repeat protein [Lachnospiraceae bacterium]|nr:leucine-rich repeat protein [Lachnospiraceae bacterium]
MRKRRVFALLLAISLVVSGNGMTVLAAEQGVDMSVLTSQEEASETDDKSGETEDTSGKAEEADDRSEETETPVEGDTVNGEDETVDGEKPEEPENPADSETSVPKEDDGEQGADQPSTEEGEDGKQDETPEEPVVETPVEEPEEEPEVKEPEEAVFKAKTYVSRMVTFTDDTGMNVTYDANASQQYIYKVENGVLTAVVEKGIGEDVSGNTIEVETPVMFEGNVELKQPEEGEKYTSIAADVFSGNQNITYVKLPAGLTSIAAESFKGCTGLKGVYIPSTVTEIGAGAFENCTAMTQISVPKAVTSIGDNAFKGDARLYMVYMKDTDYSSLEQIGAHAFDGCTALEAFCGDTQFLLPTSLKGIGEYAFYECRRIKKVNLDNAELETLGVYAFSNCIGLTDAVMCRTLSVIPQHAFEGCTALVSLTFESKAGQWVTVDEHAFEGCYSLTSLVLPGTIKEVASFAFAGCTNLYRVEIKNDNLIIGSTRAFPVGETGSTLQFIGRPGSTIYQYCRGKDKVAFIEDTNAAVKQYYKYIVKDKDGVEHADGKIPGGQIWIGPTDKSGYEDNINKLKDDKGKEGVQPSDTIKYRVYYVKNDGYNLVTNSLRANGEILRADEKGIYYVTMPVGGIILTAEFSQDASEKINGLENDVTVEYSNGEEIDNGVEIKVGQTTRIFLIDKSGEPIGTSKILDISSSDEKVVKVSKSGVVTAAGAGTATVKIKLRGGDGNPFWVQSRIKVVEADVDVLKLKATAYDSQFRITGDPNGIQTAAIDKNIVRDEALTITLKANAYTADREGIAKEFTWKSSDTKMVKLRKDTTKGSDATNVLEIQKGCVGEATITVTAKNKVSSTSAKDQKETVTQKFVVSVQSLSGRLASSSITLNPNLKDGGLLEVLLAYGNSAGVDPSKTKLYKEEGSGRYIESLDFILEKSGESEGKAYQYKVRATGETKEGTYKLFVGLNGAIPNKDNLLPLTITVKKSVPAPTIKFNTEKAKFNLFYTDGGLDKNGDPVTVTTEITKLGTAKISKVELEAISGSEDDRRFVENFEIKSSSVVNGKYTVVIGRKTGSLQYTEAKKPAVTGNLAIYYEGYEDSAAKKMKVTMPTCTTAPSYALRETKATYREGYIAKEETFVLYDKKSKTKEQVILVDGMDAVTEEEGEITTIGEPKIQPDGTIALGFMAEKGKLKLALTNRSWDLDKDGNKRKLVFTYTVNVSTATPTVKTDQSSVSLNLNYPENGASFRLVPNQRGVQLAANQKFYPASNAADINNLEVTYENGEGSVKIRAGKTVGKGTYKFVCDPPVSSDYPDLKKVTLTVKVVDNKPTIKFGKGSLQLNTQVFRDNSLSGNALDEAGNPLYREVAAIPFTVSGKPEGYAIAAVGTGSQATEIKTQYGSVDKRFTFRISEGSSEEKTSDMLEVYLDGAPPAGTYKFTMTQRYLKDGNTVSAKPVNFSVKVSGSSVDLTVSAKGKINLVNRKGEADEKNGILYTPTLKNISGEITDVKILEGGENGLEESRRFEARLIEEGKNKGKIFVTPKVTEQSETDGGTVTEQYAELKNNTNYPVRIWVKVKGYAGTSEKMNGVITKNTVKIKTSQTLPKVTTDKSTLDVYLTTKKYDASFTVRAQEGTAGAIEEVCFGEKDEVAKESFEMIQQLQPDGSVKVILHLKEAVGFANDSTNNVKMYVKYKGQGTNTPETATSFTMKIRVN